MSLNKFLPDESTNKFRYDHHYMISVLRRKLVILFLVGCFILTSVPNALCRSPAPIIYVAGDGRAEILAAMEYKTMYRSTRP
jgi:hypothetical protein